MEQVEDRISEPEDKVEELDHSYSKYDKLKKKLKKNMAHHEKTKSMNYRHRKIKILG